MRQAFGLDTDPGEALTRRARAGCERSPPPSTIATTTHTHTHTQMCQLRRSTHAERALFANADYALISWFDEKVTGYGPGAALFILITQQCSSQCRDATLLKRAVAAGGGAAGRTGASRAPGEHGCGLRLGPRRDGRRARNVAEEQLL